MKNWINLTAIIVGAVIMCFALKYDSWWGLVLGTVIILIALMSNTTSRN